MRAKREFGILARIRRASPAGRRGTLRFPRQHWSKRYVWPLGAARNDWCGPVPTAPLRRGGPLRVDQRIAPFHLERGPLLPVYPYRWMVQPGASLCARGDIGMSCEA